MSPRLTVLAIIEDSATIRLMPRVVTGEDRLIIVNDLTQGLDQVQRRAPDLALVDITMGEGGGLAMIHHIKALAPSATVIALAPATALEAGATAVSLGGAGLLVTPLEGDEVRSALEDLRARRVEQTQRAELERGAMAQARMAGWIMRIVEQAGAADRSVASRRIARVFSEATGAKGVGLYIGGHGGTTSRLMILAGVSGEMEDAPSAGSEEEVFAFAADKGLHPVALCTNELKVGHVLFRSPSMDFNKDAQDDLIFLLVAQATTTLALLIECERTSDGGAIKDPTSSAYSFAYYVDVAGREIDKAKRFGRRFAIATVMLDQPLAPGGEEDWEAPVCEANPAAVADQLLGAARETAVVARVDENEFQLLLPETDGLGAHTCLRRIVSRLAGMTGLPRVAVGAATFPHDGKDLAQLLRMARRRAEASRNSAANRVSADVKRLDKVLDALLLEHQLNQQTSPICPITLPMSDAVALVTSVVGEALRGGAAFVAVAQHADLSLSAAVRAAIPPGRKNVTLHTVDVGADPSCADIEALAIVGEHGAYALLGRHERGAIRGVHASDPLVVDLIADRVGRAGGLRVLS